jgi:hypothetical protein
MSTQDLAPSPTLEARRADAEIAARSRELDLKEREVIAAERELKLKEDDARRNRWLNPIVLGLFAAAVGLIGNFIVARVNTKSTQDIERLHGQSNLVLEAIKTGNADAACKNLLFFVGLKLLDDPQGAIQKQCATAPSGPPVLPTASGRSSVHITGTVVTQDNEPIEGATVAAWEFGIEEQGFGFTNASGRFSIEVPANLLNEDAELRVRKDGFVPVSPVIVVGQQKPILITLKKQ